MLVSSPDHTPASGDSLVTISLVPRPHPASGDSSLVTIEGFLGSADSALTDKRAH